MLRTYLNGVITERCYKLDNADLTVKERRDRLLNNINQDNVYIWYVSPQSHIYVLKNRENDVLVSYNKLQRRHKIADSTPPYYSIIENIDSDYIRVSDMLLVDDTYIVQEVDLTVPYREEIIPELPTKVMTKSINIYYKVETKCIIPNWETCLEPESIEYNIGDLTKFHSENHFDRLLDDIKSFGNFNNFICIAFNGTNIDHILLFKYLINSGYRCIEAPNSPFKMQKMKFAIHCDDTDNYSTLTIWDPANFLVRRFKQLIIDFKLEGDYLTILKEVCTRLINTLYDITGLNATDHGTASSLCYKWFENDCTAVPKAVPFKWIDEKIRNAKLGLRVEGEIAINTGNFIMVDVVSHYPTVMREHSYPTGEMIMVTDIDEARAYYERGNLGFFYCRLDQSNLLDHKILSDEEGWLATPTIDSLIESKCRVDFAMNGGYCAFVWTDSSRLFVNYVDRMKSIKEEQDRLIGTDDYNQSLRDMSKLMLNCIGGKVMQKNYPNVCNFVESVKDFAAVYKPSSKVTPFSPNSAFVENRDNDAYNNPHPSQLGMFIHAYARKYMWDHVFSKMHVYYGDTDSAVIDSKDYDLIDDSVKVKGEKKFGNFEVQVKCDKVIVIGPKSYFLSKDGRVVKYGMRGIKRSDEFWDGEEWKNIEHYKESLMELIENIMIGGGGKLKIKCPRGDFKHKHLLKTVKIPSL